MPILTINRADLGKYLFEQLMIVAREAALSLNTADRAWARFTPVGGLCLIAGWACLFLAAWKLPRRPPNSEAPRS
mgnify:CR=1 FL=1